MLSPGDYHKHVPTDPEDNLRFRLDLLRAADADPDLQRGLVELCKRDIVLFINLFVWQHNTRNTDREVGPFVLWDFQEDALRKTMDRLFGDRRSMLWEKSRELGATWLALLIFLWVCLFHDWKKFLLVSHTEDAVRSLDLDGLFGKLQFVLDHLPGWMTRGVKRWKLGFRFPATHSAITGSATTERAGVGGRATAVLLDEFSKQRDDYKILSQTADTGPRLVVGTHYGAAGAFYDLSRADSGIPKLVLHWSQHPAKGRGLYRSGTGPAGWETLDPEYDYPDDFVPVTDGSPTGGPFAGIRSPWYDEECKERNNARDVAMHLDINPLGASHQFFDAPTIHRLRAAATPPLWEGDLDYDRDSARPRRLVRREGGRLRLWFLPDSRGLPPPGKYAAGADIALGTGATPSVLAIGNADLRPSEVVGEYANPLISAEDFACFSVALCRLFHDALFCWEHAGPSGSMFTREVTEVWHYGNVYYRPASPDGVRPERSDKPGFVPNPKLTALLLESFRNATATGRLLVHSDEMLAECLAFQFNKRGDRVFHGESENTDDPTKATVNHGDRVIAGALLWKMLDQLGAREGETTRAARTQPEYLTSAWLHAERDRRRRLAQSAWGRAAYLRRR